MVDAPEWRSRRTSRRTVLRGLAGLAGMAATGVSGSLAACASGPARPDEIGALLRRRAEAYRRGDRAAWIAAVHTEETPTDQGRSPSLRVAPAGATAPAEEVSQAREDGAAYDVMRDLGVVDLDYGLPAVRDGAVVVPVRYVVAGFDTTPATAETRWAVGAVPLRRLGPAVLPWELPGMVARRSRTAAVVAAGLSPVGAAPSPVGAAPSSVGAAPAGVTVAELPVDEVLRHAETAVATVRAVWGGSHVGAVVVMPPAIGTFGRWSRESGDVGQLPAVTIGPVVEGAATGSDRVLLNPLVWADLGAEGRRVVLTHEATHLVLRTDSGGIRPAWLEEGFCEFVAYAGSRLPETSVAAPLMRQVRDHGVPARLPAAEDLAGTAPGSP